MIIFFIGSYYQTVRPQAKTQEPTIDHPTMLQEIEAFARIPSVVGREGPATEFIRSRLGGLPVGQDALGNLVLTLGSGEPRRLFVAPLDEPGYVISRIEADGYLRITPVGSSFSFGGALAHQFHEGQKMVVSSDSGPVYGAMTVPSTHLSRNRKVSSRDWPPFMWQDAFIDVGGESAKEVEALGIRFMDPVVLIKRPTILRGERIAAPSIQSKAACIALVDAARRLSTFRFDGTVVFAWTVLESLNGKGLQALLYSASEGYDEAVIYSATFGFTYEGRRYRPVEVPAPGSGVLVDKASIEGFSDIVEASHAPYRATRLRNPALKDAMIAHVGLPTRFQKTPVELVHISDVQRLAELWVHVAGGDIHQSVSVPELEMMASKQQSALPHEDMAKMLSGLIAQYGVSRAETPVREYILTLLPKWMKPVTDEAGNLSATFGKGDDHIVFIAHMDEVGFTVDSIREDGRLVLRGRPGFSWLWEGQAALVHTARGDIPAVFEPRESAFQADRRWPSGPLTLYLGVDSSEEAKAMGVEAGKSTVTMPKQMIRMGTHRVVARGLDDRAGCAALLLVASQIDPKKVKRRVTFAWSTGEEIGLVGAQTLAKNIRDASIVYPVDTFVSSDAPSEPKFNAYCPLGRGAVIRVLESANYSPRHLVDGLLSVAKANDINIQVGNTFGGTDGGPFVVYGTPSVPLSWPGRYSHSPIEVLDFRDLEALVKLIKAIVKQ